MGRRPGSGTFVHLDHTPDTPGRLEAALALFPGLGVPEFWRTADHRPRRADETWLNALVRRSI
jgi:hypothetical protein